MCRIVVDCSCLDHTLLERLNRAELDSRSLDSFESNGTKALLRLFKFLGVGTRPKVDQVIDTKWTL